MGMDDAIHFPGRLSHPPCPEDSFRAPPGAIIFLITSYFRENHAAFSAGFSKVPCPPTNEEIGAYSGEDAFLGKSQSK
jgi:hypothetical protein